MTEFLVKKIPAGSKARTELKRAQQQQNQQVRCSIKTPEATVAATTTTTKATVGQQSVNKQYPPTERTTLAQVSSSEPLLSLATSKWSKAVAEGNPDLSTSGAGDWSTSYNQTELDRTSLLPGEDSDFERREGSSSAASAKTASEPSATCSSNVNSKSNMESDIDHKSIMETVRINWQASQSQTGGGVGNSIEDTNRSCYLAAKR